MPKLEDGFKTAMLTMLIGVVFTAVIASSAPQFLPIFNLLGVAGLINTIENANYWGIGYTLGWIIAYLLVGSAFLGVSEFSLSLLVFGLYILKKILNKYG